MRNVNDTGFLNVLQDAGLAPTSLGPRLRANFSVSHGMDHVSPGLEEHSLESGPGF